MLVLTRHEGGKIIGTLPDGNEFVIVLLEIIGNKARIGLEADSSIKFRRSEVASRDALAAAGKGGGE